MLRPFPSSMRAAAITPAERSVLASLASRPMPAFPVKLAGRLPHCWFRGLRSVHFALQPAWSLGHPRRPFFIEVLQTMSLPPSSAPTVTGWSDSCRAGFAPAEKWRLVTAHNSNCNCRGLFCVTMRYTQARCCSVSLGGRPGMGNAVAPLYHRRDTCSASHRLQCGQIPSPASPRRGLPQLPPAVLPVCECLRVPCGQASDHRASSHSPLYSVRQLISSLTRC